MKAIGSGSRVGSHRAKAVWARCPLGGVWRAGFVMLTQAVLMWSIIVGDQDGIVLDADIAFEGTEDVSG